MLSGEQKERYSRHLLLEGFDQERLRAARVLVIGTGGLGSPVCLYLAAAGVGTLGIADGDVVSLSNLQRQLLHASPDLGRLKTDSASEKLRALNPEVKIVCHPEFVTDESADALVADYDFVVEATDNFASRYRINDACMRAGKPFCIGGVSHFSGQLISCIPGVSASYRDLFPEEPEASADGPLPVLGPAVGILGSIMACEVIKYLCGMGDLLTDRLLVFNALTMEFNTLTF